MRHVDKSALRLPEANLRSVFETLDDDYGGTAGYLESIASGVGIEINNLAMSDRRWREDFLDVAHTRAGALRSLRGRRSMHGANGTMAGAMELMLLSTSSVYGGGYLDFALDVVKDFLGGCRTVHFAAYALADLDEYTATIRAALRPLGVSVIGIHETADPPRATVNAAEVLFVGGGNSFRLLRAFQRLELIDVVRERAWAGQLRYWGSSAGSNLACPTIRTTNDMPIVEPTGLTALGLIPFQVNPHYVDPDPNSTHMGETREQRLLQFLEENDVPVLGLREGSLLHLRQQTLVLAGSAAARLFRRGRVPADYPPGSNLSALLAIQPRFDQEP